MSSLSKNVTYFSRCVLGSTGPSANILKVTRFGDRLVGPKTDICIEGFPRSANSFLYHYFIMANEGAVVAHHTHVPSQVIEATRLGIPTIALVRHPLDALKSVMVIDGALSVGVALWSYESFYRAVLKRLDSVVVASFETAIGEPAKIIETINEKFGSNFAATDKTSETDEVIKRRLVEHAEEKKQGLQVAVPTKEKDDLKATYDSKIREHPKFGAAVSLYEEVMKYAI